MVAFSELPHHNQMDILKKLDFKDFVNFNKCSKKTGKLAKNLRHRLNFNVRQIDIFQNYIKVDIGTAKKVEYDSFKDELVRFETQRLYVNSTSSNGIQLKDFVRKFVTKAEDLDLNADENTDSTALINLVKISHATSLTITNFTDLPDLLKQPEMGKLRTIAIFGTEMGVSDLLQLETPEIYISRDHGLELSAINKFLKQWVENKRKVEQMRILPIPREEDHLEIFEDLEFSVERTPRNHIEPIQVHHIYSLTRMDGKRLFVSLDHFHEEPRIVVRESDDLLSFVHSRYPWAEM